MGMKVSRRTALGMGAAGAAGLIFGMPALAQTSSGWRPKRRAKNVIFCVSDGMPVSALSCADQLQWIRDGKNSYWRWLMNQDFAVNGLQATRSLNSLVTDSASSSSAWGSGRKIWNGQVNMYPDKTELKTLSQLVRAKGVRTGLVTTATITHATPAGFTVNCIQRDLEGLIAEKYLEAGTDVLLGGGDKFFNPEKRKDKKDLYGAFAKAGYAVAKNRSELAVAGPGKLLGIFSDGHVPYSVDRDHSIALRRSTPTLAEMAEEALKRLKGSPNGFLLQIEGARVDHGGHTNDPAAMVYDQIAFEAAVKAAVDFAMEDGETLVVITADHACGGMALNGAGFEYIDSTDGLKTLLNMTCSYGPLWTAMGSRPDAAMVQDVVASKLGIKLESNEAKWVSDAAAGSSPFKGSMFYSDSNAVLAIALANHTKVCWTSLNHTSDDVIVTALGPGAEAFGGLHDNVDYFHEILKVWGIKHSNRAMSFADASKAYEKLRQEGISAELFELYASTDGCGCSHGHDLSWEGLAER